MFSGVISTLVLLGRWDEALERAAEVEATGTLRVADAETCSFTSSRSSAGAARRRKHELDSTGTPRLSIKRTFSH